MNDATLLDGNMNPWGQYETEDFKVVEPREGSGVTIAKPGYSDQASDVNENDLVNIVDAQNAYDIATRSGSYSVNDGTVRAWLAADASDTFAIQYAVHFGWR